MATILPFARAAAVGTTMLEQAGAGIADRADAAVDISDGDRWALWMLQAQDGDRAAYHALLQAVTPYLRAIARRYLGRSEDAEDALQDVLMIVHGIRHTYERGRPFKPWLNTIASRRCIDLLRRRAHRLQHELADGQDADDSAQAEHGPEDHAALQHAAGKLREAVAALPSRQREAIRLLRLSELSLNEAAEQSDQSIGSLKVACHRALKSLQHTFAKKEHSHD